MHALLRKWSKYLYTNVPEAAATILDHLSHHRELHSRACLELVIRYKTSVRHALDTKYELHTLIWQSSRISDHELDDADLIAAVNFHGKHIARHLFNGDLKLYPEVERVA